MSVIVDYAKEQIKNCINDAVKTALKNGELTENSPLADFGIEVPSDRGTGTMP